MAPYSSPAPSLRSIQYSAPIRALALNSASAQLLPAFSSPSSRMHGHGTRPVGLRVFRPETAMVVTPCRHGEDVDSESTERYRQLCSAMRQPNRAAAGELPGQRRDV